MTMKSSAADVAAATAMAPAAVPAKALGHSDPPPMESLEVIIEYVDQNMLSADSESDFCSKMCDEGDSGADFRKNATSDSTTPMTGFGNALFWFKHIYSAALLIFCIVVVSAAIFTKQTVATGEQGLHPVAAFVIFWILLLYLAQLEGGLNIMVGLKPVDKELYSESHPFTHSCTKLAHRGDNLDRFIVGRQYLDLTMVFTTSLMVSTIDGASVLGLPPIVSNIFLHSGMAVTLVTIVIGQLVAIINSTHCMLEYVNNRVMLASTYLALVVEASGILHAVYFVQIVVGKFAGRSYQGSKVEEITPIQSFTFWLRVLFSVSLLLFSIFVTLKAIFEGKTSVWDGVPPYASVILTVTLILIAGLMESLQIAFMRVVHMHPGELERQHPRAKRNCAFIFGKKNRLQAFLIGRQICQTVIMFVIARITTLQFNPDSPNLFGVSNVVQNVIFNSGVLPTLMSVIIASLSWRVLANTFPIAFLAFPLSRPIIGICLWTEAIGFCSVAWPLAKVHRSIFRWKNDEDYLGGMERLEEEVDHAILMSRPSINIISIMDAHNARACIDITTVHSSDEDPESEV